MIWDSKDPTLWTGTCRELFLIRYGLLLFARRLCGRGLAPLALLASRNLRPGVSAAHALNLGLQRVQLRGPTSFPIRNQYSWPPAQKCPSTAACFTHDRENAGTVYPCAASFLSRLLLPRLRRLAMKTTLLMSSCSSWTFVCPENSR